MMDNEGLRMLKCLINPGGVFYVLVMFLLTEGLLIRFWRYVSSRKNYGMKFLEDLKSIAICVLHKYLIAYSLT